MPVQNRKNRENSAQKPERWAFVLAAGIGSRLKSLTAHQPKAMLEIAGKSLIAHLLEKLANQGFTNVIVNIHHFAEQLSSYLETHDFGLKIQLSDESGQLMDTGGAILKALPLLPENEAVLIHNVDILHNFELNGLMKEFEKSAAMAALIVRDRQSSRKLIFNEKMQLIGWENVKNGQKKQVKNANHNQEILYSFSGIHFIKPALFKGLDVRPCSMIDLYLQLAERHSIVGQALNEGWWFDVGKAGEISQIEEFFKEIKL